MEINQFILMLLMALHFAPSNANKINIELSDNRKITFVKEKGDYWEASPQTATEKGKFKLKGHEIFVKLDGKEDRYLSIIDILMESGDAINWKEVNVITKEGQGSMLFERSAKGIDILFSEDAKKSANDKVFKIRWEMKDKK